MFNKKILFALVLLLNIPIKTFAEHNPDHTKEMKLQPESKWVKDQKHFNKMLERSAKVYSLVVKGKHGEIPSTILSNAKCIAIFPNFMTGALIIGGTHGRGVVSCKSALGTWSQPAPISLNQGSIGLQIGAKSGDLVLFFLTDKAQKALKQGNFVLGTDVSAVAGKFDSKALETSPEILVYTHAEGLFAGASINGGTISYDQDDLNKHYGKPVNFNELIEGRETPDITGYTQKLTKLFP